MQIYSPHRGKTYDKIKGKYVVEDYICLPFCHFSRGYQGVIRWSLAKQRLTRNVQELCFSNFSFFLVFITLLFLLLHIIYSLFPRYRTRILLYCWNRGFSGSVYTETIDLWIEPFFAKEIRRVIEWLQEIKTADQHCFKFLIIQQNKFLKLNVN